MVVHIGHRWQLALPKGNAVTSQIVLINQAGVAVSSDTLTTRRVGRGHVKTYPSVNKIHEIGGQHRVVVLQSGVTSLGGIRYELLLHEWSLTMKDAPLPHLESYVDDFLDFVGHWSKLPLDEADMIDTVICTAIDELQTLIGKEVHSEMRAAAESGNVTDGMQQQIVAAIEKLGEGRFDENPYPDLSEETALKLLKDSQDPTKHFQDHFGKFELSIVLVTALEDLLVNAMRYHTGWVDDATLNFAGFGSDDAIGGVVAYEATARYGGHLRGKIGERIPSVQDVTPCAVPIAQQDAIMSFLRGMDFDVEGQVLIFAQEVLESHSIPSDSVVKIVKQLEEKIDHYLGEDYYYQVQLTINSLSIGSLVKFADALVRMQSLRSASVGSEGTVGGRIESLLISKQMGIHWYSRVTPESIDPSISSHVFA
jgi:hypothetical protein